MKNIVINGISYEYVTSKNINNKNYIAYKDDENVYISEYKIEDNDLKLNSISEVELDYIKEILLND